MPCGIEKLKLWIFGYKKNIGKMENCKDGDHRVYRLCEMEKTKKKKKKKYILMGMICVLGEVKKYWCYG